LWPHKFKAAAIESPDEGEGAVSFTTAFSPAAAHFSAFVEEQAAIQPLQCYTRTELMALRTLIVDDEPIARAILREELEQLDEIASIEEASDGAQALEEIKKATPDLLFLDLHMPDMDGFEVIRKLRPIGTLPVIIIVTAYDQHAIRAFEEGAIDYLLKPVSPERLAGAVDRALRLRPDEAATRFASLREVAEAGAAGIVRRIVVRKRDEYLLLDSREVLAIQAEGELVWVITASERYLASQTLRALQEKMRASSFRRIHRNALVNVNHVRRMSTLSSQRWLVTLSNNLEFIVSKRHAKNIRDLLTW
jgi:DNA-binding LytR/AlgR family response regulator